MTTPFGRLLRVDLSSGQVREEGLNPDYVRDYIGGSGLGIRYLWDLVGPETEPLSPDSPLLFMTGPLTGTAGPAVGRFTVCARSPQTGLWGESNCGGFFPAELRFAGYDGVLVTGRAPSPVYLWVDDDRAELQEASHLWDRADPYQTQEAIRQKVGQPRARVASIGQAGERQVPFSIILCDHGRVAGRTGMGAVMGSKNLKAVAVHGTGEVPLADPRAYGELRRCTNAELRDHLRSQVQREMGTAANMPYFELLGDVPARYFTQGEFSAVEKIGGPAMTETILTGISACHACVIACGRRVTIREGPYARPESKGPEHETICALGSLLLIDDLPAITHLSQLCDRLGLDTISTGGTIGLALYLYSEGIIRPTDTGGLKLRWNDPQGVARLIELTARREGFGALLAQGSLGLARHFGVEELAVQVNGLEVSYHDPRAMSGMALVYATSPRGACHNQGDYYMVEIGQSDDDLGIPFLDRQQVKGKAAPVARLQDWRSVSNSLVQCIFALVPAPDVLALLNAATGRDWDLAQLMRAGARIWNLKRALNCRLGLTRASERLPALLRQPLTEGGTGGFVPDLERMLEEYYAVRGWDPETGRPTRETLVELGLGFAADEFTAFVPDTDAQPFCYSRSPSSLRLS